jgi:hypothetical protein
MVIGEGNTSSGCLGGAGGIGVILEPLEVWSCCSDTREVEVSEISLNRKFDSVSTSLQLASTRTTSISTIDHIRASGLLQ